ncbi:alpha/beta hydrolase [Lutimonas halocynthiae]|uniref:alpha/beta fold hydrolase n=1 Tax=Lutimonas halocynthiae TaxID=1446477 RepID=UPI0025B3F7D7|nr:alpha/beta hydrolase [Lutimonas halocynthiae]MDN3641823.1 alpha/beta hydrolase [Lutimonas halocynthiae]
MKGLVKILKRVILSLLLIALVISVLFGYRDMPFDELKSKYAPVSSRFMPLDGMDVHFRDEGNKTDSIPIVLIHGTGSSLHTFDDWAANLKEDYRVIRMDLPAYGLTGPFPDRNYSIDNYVIFIKNFLASLGIKKCRLAGNSLGGNIAWNFTLQYPDMVDKLILIDAAGYPASSKSIPIAFKIARIPVLNNMFTYISPRFIVESSVKNVYADKSKVTDIIVDRYFELSLREGNRQAFVDRLSFYDKVNAHLKIKNIQQPTLVLWGAEDLLIPIEKANLFHEDLPNDTLVIIKNSGHIPMEESPMESLKALRSFLKD